jgi:hypothetical protein
MNLKTVEQILVTKLGSEKQKLINTKEFIELNKKAIFKQKIEKKEIIFDAVESCFESRKQENVPSLIENLTDIVKKNIELKEKEIKKEHKDNLLYISDYKIINYNHLKISFEISYIISNKEESFLFFLEEELNKKIEDVELRDDNIIFNLGKYELKLNYSNYASKHNIGNIKRKFFRQNRNNLVSILYFYKLLN